MLCQLVDLGDFCDVRELHEHERVRLKVVNCKPDRLVIVEYAPMHLKGCYARVPALIVAVVFTPPNREFDRSPRAKRLSMHP